MRKRISLPIAGDAGMRIWRNAAGALVHIHAKDRSVESLIDESGLVELIISSAAVAHTNIEEIIRTEMQVASIVIGCLVRLRPERLLGGRISAIEIVRREAET